MSRSIRRGHRRLAVYFAAQFARNSRRIRANHVVRPIDEPPGAGEMLQTKGIVGIAVAVVLGLLLVAPLTMAKGTRIELQAGPLAPRGVLGFPRCGGEQPVRPHCGEPDRHRHAVPGLATPQFVRSDGDVLGRPRVNKYRWSDLTPSTAV